VRFLIAFFGHKPTEPEALRLVESLGQGGHLFIDEKCKVTYHLQPKCFALTTNRLRGRVDAWRTSTAHRRLKLVEKNALSSFGGKG
jgi:hypothetical protein